MLIIDNLFQITNSHWSTSQIVNFGTLFFLTLILWLQTLLILDEFGFHNKIILDAFHLQQLQATSGHWNNRWQLGGGIWTLSSLLLLANSRWNWWFVSLLFLNTKITVKLARNLLCRHLLGHDLHLLYGTTDFVPYLAEQLSKE